VDSLLRANAVLRAYLLQFTLGVAELFARPLQLPTGFLGLRAVLPVLLDSVAQSLAILVALLLEVANALAKLILGLKLLLFLNLFLWLGRFLSCRRQISPDCHEE